MTPSLYIALKSVRHVLTIIPMPDYLEDRHGGGDAYLGTPHHWTSEYSVEFGVIQAALEMYVATDQRCLVSSIDICIYGIKY